MLELGLNLKKCIRFCERSEKNLMHFFEFKADSNIGCALLFYTLLETVEKDCRLQCYLQCWTYKIRINGHGKKGAVEIV